MTKLLTLRGITAIAFLCVLFAFTIAYCAPDEEPSGRDAFSCRSMAEADGRRATIAAFEKLKQQSDNGDAAASLRVGHYYLTGLCYLGSKNVGGRPGYVEGVIAAQYYIQKPDCDKAKQYLTKAAHAGENEANALLEKAKNCEGN